MSKKQDAFEKAEGFSQTKEIVLGRCSMCHARQPVWDGINWAPDLDELETRSVRKSRRILANEGNCFR